MGCIKLIAYYTTELYVRQRSLNKMVQEPLSLKKRKKILLVEIKLGFLLWLNGALFWLEILHF